ncbi:non-ribosomal peptide synthetase [Amycolatopsis sp. DG1A-15b]|uniref:non-ribosomal peptide synthetase n=1 Tax=Amycolatopsis sp. DG1A-15b TaxID=3052846 RepID=UPI00255B9276|nr:non-ribosomal peptide synthetase [Amycolatopsis sp. DG1A-15b]WIX92950.1 amino acid adenylation domain-containing protein [Amycolatopsis sp. DG1A-15b]
MSRPEVAEVHPLVPLQAGMLFHSLYDENSTDVYIVQFALELTGPLDVSLLRESCEVLIARHAALRSAFVHRRTGEPVRVVAKGVAIPWREYDLTTGGAGAQRSREDDVLADERARRFAMTRPPLVRFALIRSAPERAVLAVTAHHAILDGWSVPLVLEELLELYAHGADPSALPPVAPYAGYQRWLDARDDVAAGNAWQVALSDLAGPTLAAPGAGLGNPAAPRRLTAVLPEAEVGLLGDVARSRNLTPSTILQGVWALVLSAMTGVRDVVSGIQVTGRNAEVAGIERLVGIVMNTVPMRARLNPAEPAAEFFARLQLEQAGLFEHHHLGLPDIQRAAGFEEPLFDTTFVYENIPYDAAELANIVPGLAVRLLDDDADPEATHYPLNFVVFPGPSLRFELGYRPDVISGRTASIWLDLYLKTVRRILRDPNQPLGRLPALPGRDEVGSTGTLPPASPSPSSLVDVFTGQVERTPDAVAMVADGQRITFSELGVRVERLARELHRHGAVADRFVAAAVPRSADALVAVLAILRSGAAYLPIDPDQPGGWIAEVLARTGPVVGLTTADLAVALPGIPGGRWISGVDGEGPGSDAALPPHGAGCALAYAIPTSGSTGQPKIVLVEQHSLSNMFHSHERHYYAKEATGNTRLRVALTYAMTFDGFWSPLFWMVAGHELHLLDDTVRKDTEALVAYVHQHALDVVETTPSHVELLLSGGLLEEPGPRVLALGGEPISPELWLRLRRADVSAYNMYGPTECTIDPLYCRIDDVERPSIGEPADNNRIHVLDTFLRPVAEGVVGELYISGEGVARGYAGRPGATAERFVACTAGNGERMYRTGDLVRRDSGGELCFVGRADDQVKIRGFRVEPRQAELVIAALPEVAQAAVVVRADQFGDPQLVAYVVPAPGSSVDPHGVRTEVSSVLPAHMVPAVVVALDVLPTTTSGKLDRRALPAPKWTSQAARAARTLLEAVVADAFAAALDVAAIDPDDDFFRLGGHSLLVTKLVGRLRSALRTEISVRDVFDHPTAAGLALLLDGRAGRVAPPRLEPRRRPAELPLSAPQRRLWALAQIDGTSAPYNVPSAWRLRGGVDRVALASAIGDVALRHEALRTVFPVTNGEPRQRILDRLPGVEFLECVDEKERRSRIAEAERAPFDLSGELPIRVRLCSVGDQDHVLSVVIHHSATDGWSAGPFALDLAAAYEARVAATAPAWSPLPVQYADYTLWLEEFLSAPRDSGTLRTQQLRYWRTALAGLATVTNLPTDRPRPARRNHDGDHVRAVLGTSSHNALRDLARQHNVTLFMVVQAALSLVLSRLGAGSDIAVGTPSAARADPALDGMVGFFANTMVLRTDVSGEITFAELLTRVRAADLEAFANADVAFDEVVGAIDPARLPSVHPLFQVVLVARDTGAPALKLTGLAVEEEPPAHVAARFDLTFEFGVVSGDELELALVYAVDLFDRATANAMVDRLGQALLTVADAPTIPIRQVDVLLPEERGRIAKAAVGRSPGECLHEVFQDRARATPQAIAVIAGDERLTYAELDSRADRLANHLLARPLTGPVIGIHLERGPELLVALLAVLKAGRAYALLDVEFPPEWVATVAGDSGMSLVLSTSARARTVEWRGVEVLNLMAEAPLLPETSSSSSAVSVDPDAPACAMFTSGSTGRPKCVLAPHRALTGTYLGQDYLSFGADQVWLQLSPVSWDAFALEVFGALLFGGTTVLYPGAQIDLDTVAHLVAEHGVTSLQLSASLFNLLVDERPEVFDGLTQVMTAGEAASASHVATVLARCPRLRVVNGYGPVETLGFSTAHDIVPADVERGSIPIGHPVAGKAAFVLDTELRPVPDGVPGELYLGGVGLARGYLGRAAGTATRFVACPFGPAGARIYRTGDLVRRTRTGVLEYLGRLDDQAKVNGFRVEPGAVEQALSGISGVRRAAVVVRDDRWGKPALTAYVEGTDVDPARLRAALSEVLPRHLVPTAFIGLADLPLTTNGKLDRGALRQPHFEADEGRRPVATSEEALLATLFSEVLGVPEVGPDDDFFALGGHSVSAIRLAARARSANLVVTAQQVFAHPTVADLATHVTRPDPGDSQPHLDGSLELDADELAEVASWRNATTPDPAESE